MRVCLRLFAYKDEVHLIKGFLQALVLRVYPLVHKQLGIVETSSA